MFFKLYMLSVYVQGLLSLGYSTLFLSLGSSYMYPSWAAANTAIISTQGFPLGIFPLVIVFTGYGNGMVIESLHGPLLVNNTLTFLIAYNTFLRRHNDK